MPASTTHDSRCHRSLFHSEFAHCLLLGMSKQRYEAVTKRRTNAQLARAKLCKQNQVALSAVSCSSLHLYTIFVPACVVWASTALHSSSRPPASTISALMVSLLASWRSSEQADRTRVALPKPDVNTCHVKHRGCQMSLWFAESS